LRPTAVQALAHGLFVGGMVGAPVGAVACATCALAFDHGPAPAVVGVGGLTGVLAGALLGAVAGGLIGLVVGRSCGADVDGLGVHPVPYAPGSLIPWRYVVDLHVERRGARIVVVLVLTSGESVALRAPYVGRLLAGDPEFERKLFALRNQWETHRTFNIYPD
jgi:hypothetical protein